MNTKDNVFDRQLANTSFYAALNYDPTESITQEINTFIKKMFSDAEIGKLCFQLPPQYTHEVRQILSAPPNKQQGKSEGFDSCDRPSNLTQIEFKSLIFDGWPQKTMGHLFYATLSFLHHFVAIG